MRKAVLILAVAAFGISAAPAEARSKGRVLMTPAAVAAYAAISHYEYFDGPAPVYYLGPYVAGDPYYAHRFWRHRW